MLCAQVGVAGAEQHAVAEVAAQRSGHLEVQLQPARVATHHVEAPLAAGPLTAHHAARPPAELARAQIAPLTRRGAAEGGGVDDEREVPRGQEERVEGAAAEGRVVADRALLQPHAAAHVRVHAGHGRSHHRASSNAAEAATHLTTQRRDGGERGWRHVTVGEVEEG